MKVHHLNCGSMCPPLGKRMVNETGKMVCHCLLVETDAGLALVDTGISAAEAEDPKRWLGRFFAIFANPEPLPELAAVRQVERLGFKAADVKHIFVTHLDLDHAGGIPDFPAAKVHIYGVEHDAAMARATVNERNRYKPHQWKDAAWVRHAPDGQGDEWFGFAAVKQPIPGMDIAIVPLVGHTRGHCGIAVRDTDGWLLHCGDAYFFAQEVNPDKPYCTPGLRLFQRIVAIDNHARLENQRRLRDLVRDRHREVRVFSAHDPSELALFP
jgi:glyoxylase-like metal-dependent hydrolase (beta-lactamase superfamily II)